MRRSRRGLLLLIFAAGCPPGAVVPSLDGGADAGADAGITPLPPLCPDLDGGTCSDAALCCPGLLCSSGHCIAPINPCPPGERPRANGCACDPLAADAGCACDPRTDAGCSDAGPYTCFADLHCHPLPDVSVAPCGIRPFCPSSAPICVAALPAVCTCTTSNGDSCNLVGQICDQIPPTPTCRAPLAGEPCMPNLAVHGGGCEANSIPPLACEADPSGARLYVCTAVCLSNADCPNGWQFCSIPDGGTTGRCVDNPCDRPYSPCSMHLPGGSSAAQGLCLPFGVLQANPDGTKQAVAFGLCLEASLQSGATGVACDRLFRRAIGGGGGGGGGGDAGDGGDGGDAGDGGPSTDAEGGPGSFCNLVNVCTPSGACAPACSLADAGPGPGLCLGSGLHCKTIDPRPFSTARDPDSGVLVGSGACQ